jgi:hypothetical protein
MDILVIRFIHRQWTILVWSLTAALSGFLFGLEQYECYDH